MLNRPFPGITNNPLIESPYVQGFDEGTPSPPPATDNFLLLNGDDFLLLSGSNLLLL